MELFNTLDADCDGLISAADLEAVAGERGVEALYDMDIDGDVVTLAAFLRTMCACEAIDST